MSSSIQQELWVRSTATTVEEAHSIIQRAAAEHKAAGVFVLFSGGNDSLVLLDVAAPFASAVVHVNTGIGIPDANVFAREVGSSYGLPFLEYHPPVPYDELILTHPVLDGLPGPGVHNIVYQRLKERCIRQLLRDHQTKPGQRFLLLTGVRKAESRRRMGYSDPVDRNGREVWVNPLLFWSNEEMRAYRMERSLPTSPVAANLHMSGECLCGAMADQGPAREERAQIRFFYPEFDARLTKLEEACRAAGKTYCEWGVKRIEDRSIAGKMCQSCDYRTFFEEEAE